MAALFLKSPCPQKPQPRGGGGEKTSTMSALYYLGSAFGSLRYKARLLNILTSCTAIIDIWGASDSRLVYDRSCETNKIEDRGTEPGRTWCVRPATKPPWGFFWPQLPRPTSSKKCAPASITAFRAGRGGRILSAPLSTPSPWRLKKDRRAPIWENCKKPPVFTFCHPGRILKGRNVWVLNRI